MIPLAISLALRTRSMLGAMLGWIGRNPIVAALCGAVVALALCVHIIGVKDRTIARLTAQAVSFREAQAQATVIAQQALHHQEAVYQAKAQDTDHAYQTQLVAAQSSADMYIATHRVRPNGAGSTGPAIAAATGSNPGSVVGPGDPAYMVAVSADDINVCTVNTQRLQAGHNWALGLNTTP